MYKVRFVALCLIFLFYSISISAALETSKISTSQGDIAIVDSKPTYGKNYPTVVFIHGHCTHKRFFSHQLQAPLLAEYRLIALDLPGYGESDPPNDPQKVYNFPGFADVVCEVINTLELENFAIVGWSLGGHVALELTSRLPKLKGILITGTPPIEISADGLGRGFRIADPRILECFGKGNLTEEEAGLLATISGYDYSPEKKFIVDAIFQTDEGVKTIYPQSILKGIGQNEVDIVGKWLKPIAVIAGENEKAINNDYIIYDVYFRNLWRGKVHLISEAGHAVFMEKPDSFNLLLKDFLADILSPINVENMTSKKVVLVTGASKGIGLATAELLASQGYEVYGTSREKSGYVTKHPNFHLEVLDVTKDSSVQALVKKIIEQAGRIDILINNAGFGLGGPLECVNIEEIEEQFDVNFLGVVRMCQQVLPHMRRQNSGHIVNISSYQGIWGLPYGSSYSASKAALEVMSEALSIEVLPWNIKVSIVEPGHTATDFFVKMGTRKLEANPYKKP